MMEARPVHGVLHVHVEIDHVQDHLQHAVDDARSARRAQHQEELAVAQQDGRRHGRERPLARLDGVGFALDQAEQILLARLGGEIVHFVVQQESQARDRDAAAVAAVQRVGDRHGVALAVDDVVMRGLGAFVGRQIARANLVAGRGVLRIDAGAAARDVARIEQLAAPAL